MPPDQINTETAILILACAGAMQQRLFDLISFQNRQIRVLKRLVADGEHRPTDDERRQLARLAHDLDRQTLALAETIVTPDNLRRWYRRLIAETYTGHRRGRPRIGPEIEALIVRLATENPSWGYETIVDRARELGHKLCSSTVANVLQRHGLPPAPEREEHCDWQRFIAAHWPGLVAIDCATWEVPDPIGRKTDRHHALYAMRVATREVRLLGVTDHANGAWVTNCIRNLTAFDEKFPAEATHVIMDRDPIFIDPAKECFRSVGCEIVLTPPQSPKCNAFIERFIGTTRREVGRNIIPLSTEALHSALVDHVSYYNHHRTHQALPDRRMPVPRRGRYSADEGEVVRHGFLGNSLSYYERRAA